MSERPWWFPTAVPAMLAAWATVTLSWALAEFAPGRGWRWADGFVWVCVAALLARFLVMHEDSHRDRLRPDHLDRWGRERRLGELAAAELWGPPLGLAAVLLALVVATEIWPGITVPVILGLAVVTLLIDACSGSPPKVTGVWWPAMKYRWRSTMLLLILFELTAAWPPMAVMLVTGRFPPVLLLFAPVALYVAWRVGRLLQTDPRDVGASAYGLEPRAP